MDGFSVDVNALTAAGQGIRDLMGKLDEKKVEDIDCDSDAVGHGGLAGKLESFCDRWQIGVENLLEDGAQIAQRLLDSAAAYRDRDNSAAAAMGGGQGG
jgi:hypothetical protein